MFPQIVHGYVFQNKKRKKKMKEKTQTIWIIALWILVSITGGILLTIVDMGWFK